MSDRTHFDIRLGNCLDPEYGLATLAERSVDHVITDPPYEAEAHEKGRRIDRKGTVRAVSLDFSPVADDTRRRAAREMARVARRWILIFCQVEAVHLWREALELAGARYIRTGVWLKSNAQPQLTGDRPGMGYESIVIAHAGAGRLRWNGGGRPAVWNYSVETRDRVHPTQKPLALMSTLVADFSEVGETILDPFAGSGTTGVAALRAGRQFLGWELLDKYYGVASHRLSAAREQLSFFEPKLSEAREQLGFFEPNREQLGFSEPKLSEAL